MMTPEDVVARAMLAAVKRKGWITFIDLDKLSYIPRAKYGVKPIFVAFGTKKGVKDLKPVRLMVTDDAMWTLKRASFEAHCSVSELCHAIVMQWMSEHESEIKKD